MASIPTDIALNHLAFVCIGHRGACGYQPENTLASFRQAIDMGCPWIELDVYAVEGELLVIHDDTLNRTTNGKGRVMDTDLVTLRGLDAGKGEKIPTLTEVIELAGHSTGINVELKGPDTAELASSLVNAYCAKGWAAEQFLFSSFDHEELSRTDPVFLRGPLFHKDHSDMLAIARSLNAFSLHLNKNIATTDKIEAAHQAGLKVYAYTVNKGEEVMHLMERGIDGVFTNYPDRVFSLLT